MLDLFVTVFNRCSAKYCRTFAGEFLLNFNLIQIDLIFTLKQITGMADSHGIKITDNLRNYYK